MGRPGDEHIDIASLMGTGAERVTEIRTRFVDPFAPAAETPSVGKVLYVSPGDWVLPLTGRLVLPQQVEVMFAPGGRLIPIGTGAVLRIEGRITAPIGPIFITSAGKSSALRPGELAILGRVELTGERLERIHPEWWGAGGFRRAPDGVSAAELRAIANEDTKAIEVAIRTASDWRTDPVVVELVGTYLLAQTVRVGRGPFPPGDMPTDADGEPTTIHSPVSFWDHDQKEVELSARLRAPDDPTFRAHTAFAGSEMLDVRSVASFRIRGVSFDTRGEATVCLALRDPFQFTVTDAPHEITQCSFRGASSPREPAALLRMQRSTPYGAAPSSELAHSAPNVVIDACVFDIASTTGVATRLIGDGAAAAEFRGCTFVGSSAAMIHASSVEVIASSCRFENTLIPTALRGAALDPTTRARILALHSLMPEGGLDVFLDSARPLSSLQGVSRTSLQVYLRPRELPPPVPPPRPPEPKYANTVHLEGRGGFVPVQTLIFPSIPTNWDLAVNAGGFRDDGVGGIVPGLSMAPQRSIYAQDCRSTSPQFLATAQDANRTSMADATLIGLHHGFSAPQSTSSMSLIRPPAIHWRAATGDNPPKLILTGCRFDNISLNLSLERVIGPTMMTAMHPAVIEYGLCDGAHRGTVSAGTRDLGATPGLFASGMQVGFVAPRP